MHCAGSVVLLSWRSDNAAILGGVECTGEEDNILDCAYDLVTSQCSNESAALQCVGMVKGSIGYIHCGQQLAEVYVVL